MNNPRTDYASSVSCARWGILQSTVTCWHCRQRTSVLALVVPPEAVILHPHSTTLNTQGTYRFIGFVEFASPCITDALRKLTPKIQRVPAVGIGAGFWTNHCEHCGNAQGDHLLHNGEGGAGAFNTMSALSKADAVHVLTAPAVARGRPLFALAPRAWAQLAFRKQPLSNAQTVSKASVFNAKNKLEKEHWPIDLIRDNVSETTLMIVTVAEKDGGRRLEFRRACKDSQPFLLAFTDGSAAAGESGCVELDALTLIRAAAYSGGSVSFDAGRMVLSLRDQVEIIGDIHPALLFIKRAVLEELQRSATPFNAGFWRGRIKGSSVPTWNFYVGGAPKSTEAKLTEIVRSFGFKDAAMQIKLICTQDTAPLPLPIAPISAVVEPR